MSPIDVNFDFRSDAGGRDPDTHSPTLRRYHELLWTKPLPDGTPFDLLASGRPYLLHDSALGRFTLSSDTITTRLAGRAASVISQVPDGALEPYVGYTIGSSLVFPGNRIDGKWTINQARGCNRKIADRFDLTLECIRRHYVGQDSPLSAVLSRYESFFALFNDFAGYVDFFLLGDLVTEGGSEVRFFTDDFENFKTSAVPRDVPTYVEYRRRTMNFVRARNERIESAPALDRQ